MATEPEFQVPSNLAIKAVKTANELIQWAQTTGKEKFTHFFCELEAKFDSCFVHQGSLKTREETMWQKYHKLRISASFREEWDKFLRASIGQAASPTFFQAVSHRIFRELVKIKHPILEENCVDQPSPITKEEEMALRYVSGYICRRVQEKIKASALPNKEDMLLFISDFSGDEWDETNGTEEWTNAIDRGGLWHVNDDTYSILYLMEEVIRKYLTASSAKTLDAETKATILNAIITNEDILFQWGLLSAIIDESVSSVVLKQIAELYVTVRGFAFASSCLELYKQKHKKKTQKSKALRKKLATE